MLYRLNLYAGFVNNDLLWFIGYVLILVIVINIQCITINIISIPSSVTVTVRAGLTHTSHIPVPSLIFRRSRGHHMCQVIQCTEWNPPPANKLIFKNLCQIWQGSYVNRLKQNPAFELVTILWGLLPVGPSTLWEDCFLWPFDLHTPQQPCGTRPYTCSCSCTFSVLFLFVCLFVSLLNV